MKWIQVEGNRNKVTVVLSYHGNGSACRDDSQLMALRMVNKGKRTSSDLNIQLRI